MLYLRCRVTYRRMQIYSQESRRIVEVEKASAGIYLRI